MLKKKGNRKMTLSLVLVLILLAIFVALCMHFIKKASMDRDRAQNAAFIASQRKEIAKRKREREEEEEKVKKLQEVKTSSWETLNTKPDLSQREDKDIEDLKPAVVVGDALWKAEASPDDVNVAENLFSRENDTSNLGEKTAVGAESDSADLYSYQNLTRAHSISRRETLPTRDAWTRNDNMNPALWESQVRFMKEKIQSTGQTLEEFQESSLIPIPEQFAELWRTSESQMREPKRERKREPVPTRYAASEAESLIRDATQFVDLEDASLAAQSLIEIARAVKRSSQLGILLPSFPKSTSDAIKKWSSSEDALAKEAALSLVNVI